MILAYTVQKLTSLHPGPQARARRPCNKLASLTSFQPGWRAACPQLTFAETQPPIHMTYTAHNTAARSRLSIMSFQNSGTDRLMADFYNSVPCFA